MFDLRTTGTKFSTKWNPNSSALITSGLETPSDCIQQSHTQRGIELGQLGLAEASVHHQEIEEVAISWRFCQLYFPKPD